LLYNDIHLPVFIWWPGACSEAWKHQNTTTEARRRRKMRFFDFFEVTYQKSLKTDPFWKVSCKKLKIGTLVTTELGGVQYQSSIGICQGPVMLLE
jgi:hypothetical protein